MNEHTSHITENVTFYEGPSRSIINDVENEYDENVDEDVLNEGLNADGDDGEDGDGDLVGNERDLERFLLRTLKAKVNYGWSREETLAQLRNFFEYTQDENVPHQNWQSVVRFLKEIGYEDPKCRKICFGEDHVVLLEEGD